MSEAPGLLIMQYNTDEEESEVALHQMTKPSSSYPFWHRFQKWHRGLVSTQKVQISHTGLGRCTRMMTDNRSTRAPITSAILMAPTWQGLRPFGRGREMSRALAYIDEVSCMQRAPRTLIRSHPRPKSLTEPLPESTSTTALFDLRNMEHQADIKSVS